VNENGQDIMAVAGGANSVVSEFLNRGVATEAERTKLMI